MHLDKIHKFRDAGSTLKAGQRAPGCHRLLLHRLEERRWAGNEGIKVPIPGIPKSRRVACQGYCAAGLFRLGASSPGDGEGRWTGAATIADRRRRGWKFAEKAALISGINVSPNGPFLICARER